MSKRVVLALGGNAILQPKQEASYDNQYKNVFAATRKMAELKKLDITLSLHMVMDHKSVILLHKMKLQKTL